MFFEISAAARVSAHKFLRAFPPTTARKGMAYFVGDAVQAIKPLAQADSFSAEVTGARCHRTVLAYEGSRSKWVEQCSCGTAAQCRHAYALMKALLVAPVRPNEDEAKATPATEPSKSLAPSPFAKELEVHLRRKLSAEEVAYLKALSTVYSNAQKNGGLLTDDWEALGFKIAGTTRDRGAIWPAFPETEREFWLYLAVYLQDRDLGVPVFMEPVSDPEPVRERVEQWKRTREIERWKKLLSHLHEDVPVAPPRALDLRLRFGQTAIQIEWRRAGDADFVPIKAAQYKALANVPANECTPEAALLCHWFVERAEFGLEPVLRYAESDAQSILNEVLRVPWISSSLVAEDGRPLKRPEAPLQWRLVVPTDESGDYSLRLMEPESVPAGPFLFIGQGSPTLYVTSTAIWTGPEVDARALDPGAEVSIPATAIESGHGVRFLRRLGVELPSRLLEKIRTVEVRPRIRCDIQPTWAGAKEESCILEALATSDDEHLKMDFTPDGWRAQGEGQPTDAGIYYDRTALSAIPVLLEPLGLKWDEHRSHWHFKVTKKFADTFSAWLKSLPPEVPVELGGELASFQKDAVAGSVRLDIQEAGMDWFDLRVVLDVSETELTKEELKLLLDARGGWVRLGTKGWRRLEFQLTGNDDEQLARLGLSASDLSSEPQRLHALQLADKAARRFLPEDQCDQIERRVAELQARVVPDVPACIRADLRPYQKDGFHFLAYLKENNFGGVLADDMGLGKTLQTLTWLAWLRELPGAEALRPSLVVCPKSVSDNWRAESERFYPGLRVRVWGGTQLSALPKQTASADLHVINYAQLRSIGQVLTQVKFLAVILDEGQFIKNPSSATAQLARSLNGAHRLVLSGTPIENRLLDLWSLMSFAMPGALGSRAQFAKLYDSKEDPHARRRLSARVRPFVLRRTKNQVATDLPDRIEEDLYCELEGEQHTLYRAELKRAQQMLLHLSTQKQLSQERFHVLTSLMRLRQICCHPRLVKPESKASSAKLDALMETVEPLIEEGQKVLVFSQFVEMLDILRESIEARNWPLFYLAGGTENRGALVRDFQAHEGPAVFLISLKAGGFGLNLTAASYVVLFDPWWNPAVENQAIDRTHRIGQKSKIIAYRLLIKDSIEEKIRALQTGKRALAEDVLGEEKFAQTLTLEDFKYLFAE